MRSLILAVVALGLVACNEKPTEPEATESAGVAFDFMNGPAELPNLIRFESRWGFWMRDPETGLVAAANLPADPRNLVLCGGTETADFVPMQHVGYIRDVLHMISNDGDAMLHVYRSADIPNALGFCTADWVARGTGRFMNTDNDLLASGTRANSWKYHLTGAVELADGSGMGQLNAYAHFVSSEQQGLRLLNRWIRLQ